MPLINCTECGKEISDQAAACPHCGKPMSVPDPEPKMRINGDRKCLKCGYVGQMETWQRNNIAPQFIALILLMFYVIPGLIFIAWAWGKYKCPKCGAIDQSMPAQM